MRISVIIPTLNEESYIERTLRSLTEQTFRDYEVILVDGGSKDRTIEHAKKYPVKIIVSEGANAPASRNLGAKHAEGEIFVFTEADTVAPKDWLENIHQEYAKDKDLIALIGSNSPYDAQLIGRLEYVVWNAFRGLLFLPPLPFKRPIPSGSNTTIRRDAFEKVGGYNQSLIINDDGEIGRRLMWIGKIKFCPQIRVELSARRLKEMGFSKYNFYYLFILGNVFYSLPSMKFFQKIQQWTNRVFRESHLK